MHVNEWNVFVFNHIYFQFSTLLMIPPSATQSRDTATLTGRDILLVISR